MANPDSLVQAGLVGGADDAGPVGVFVADESMRYVAVNQFACELLGYTREELLELAVDDVAPWPETPREYVEVIVGEKRSGRARLRRKDGSELVTRFRTSETRILGMRVFVAIHWPADDG